MWRSRKETKREIENRKANGLDKSGDPFTVSSLVVVKATEKNSYGLSRDEEEDADRNKDPPLTSF